MSIFRLIQWHKILFDSIKQFSFDKIPDKRREACRITALTTPHDKHEVQHDKKVQF